MKKHAFIFNPGTWVGEGKITFSASPEHLRFYTRWTLEHKEENQRDEFLCKQQVESVSGEEAVYNQFRIYDVTDKTFKIDLSNNLVGVVHGTGVIDDSTIAWEFRTGSAIEGFEVYEIQENGDYMVHAEYTSNDQFRTIIDGRIWPKSQT